jgi:hypothetical protein
VSATTRPGRRAGLAAAGLAAAALLACSTTPRAGAMRLREGDLAPGGSHPGRLALHVEGGGRAEWQVHDAAFEDAVPASLVQAGSFSALVAGGDADYRLDVVLGDLRQPISGLNEPTEMTVLWSLSRVDDEETVWQELVESSGVSHNFFAAWRLRGGAEEAARRNIREALSRLAGADF